MPDDPVTPSNEELLQLADQHPPSPEWLKENVEGLVPVFATPAEDVELQTFTERLVWLAMIAKMPCLPPGRLACPSSVASVCLEDLDDAAQEAVAKVRDALAALAAMKEEVKA